MAHGKSRKLDHSLRAAGLVTSACSPLPTGLTGYLELLSMEDQDASNPSFSSHVDVDCPLLVSVKPWLGVG